MSRVSIRNQLRCVNAHRAIASSRMRGFLQRGGGAFSWLIIRGFNRGAVCAVEAIERPFCGCWFAVAALFWSGSDLGERLCGLHAYRSSLLGLALSFFRQAGWSATIRKAYSCVCGPVLFAIRAQNRDQGTTEIPARYPMLWKHFLRGFAGIGNRRSRLLRGEEPWSSLYRRFESAEDAAFFDGGRRPRCMLSMLRLTPATGPALGDPCKRPSDGDDPSPATIDRSGRFLIVCSSCRAASRERELAPRKFAITDRQVILIRWLLVWPR